MKAPGFMLKSSLMIVISLVIGAAPPSTGAESGARHDDFYTTGEMNKASIVILQEKGIMPKS